MTIVPGDDRLTTAQRVAQGAGFGEMLFRRWLAAMLDLVLLAGALWGAVYGGQFVFGADAAGPAIWAWLFLLAVYFPFAEGLWGGSLGKYAASISVIDEAGRRPGVVRALIRAFVGVIEVNPLCMAGLPALIAIALTKNRQRLGDIAAQTYVVPSEALARARADPASVFD